MNPFRKLFSLAFNTAESRATAFGMATNVAAISGDEWQLLAPYGETEYWNEEKPGKWKKYTQVFTRKEAEEMATAFNALREKRGSAFRGLPIYIGHPDADPKRWPDDKRYGGLMGMEPRADGLYAQNAWNDLGKKNLSEGYYIYPSPAWLYDERAAQKSGRIVPDELRSVGLTNTPRIPGSAPWTNVDAAPAPGDASLADANNPTDPAGQPTTKKDTTMNHRAMLLKLLGMKDDATDDQIQTAHDGHMQGINADKQAAKDAKAQADAADAAKNTAVSAATAANTARDLAQADAARFRKMAFNVHLDTALTGGRISAAERPAFESKFEADFDGALTELNLKKPALNTLPIKLGGAASDDLSSAANRRMAFNSFLDRLMRPVAHSGEGLSFDAAMAKMEGDEKGAALLAAMKEADKPAAK